MDTLKEIKKLSKGKKVVFVSGNFNIVHPGHLRLLRFAKECGDFLIVGVLSDSLSQNAIIHEDQRLEAIQSTSWVDFAFILTEETEVVLGKLKPDIVVKGKEHEKLNNPENDVINAYGGKLLFSSGDVTFSSIKLLKEEFDLINPSTIEKPHDYLQRHNFSFVDLKNILKRTSSLKVAVIGDLIIDEYIECDPLGMSQEDPTIVVTPVMTEKFVGGAGIVAAHAKGLGAKVDFFSVVGNDENAQYAKTKLKEYGVRSHLYIDESRPTTHKKRYRAEGKTLLRVSDLRQHSINNELIKKILTDLKKVLKTIDLLVFSDFNYGCLPQILVDELIKYCRENAIMMVADSQSSSQTGDISRFLGMKLITPTEHEARIALKDFDSGLVVLAEKLRKKTGVENVIITLGEEGIYIHIADFSKEWFMDKLPALNTLPRDTAGAGDSFLIFCSMALTLGADIWLSSCLGAFAAAVQVARIGNTPLSIGDLDDEF